MNIHNRARPDHASPFTLVELLLVLAILAVLVSLIGPLLADSARRAREHQCSDNLRHIGLATASYNDVTDGWFPITHGQLSTEPTARDQPLAPASRSSMALFADGLETPNTTLTCPTFQRRSPLPIQPTTPDTRFWGYNKWAGTLNTRPLIARQDHYSRYQDINHDISAKHPRLRHPGYLTVARIDKAVRKHIVLGNSAGGALAWQSAYRPRAVVPIRGNTPIPPSEITLFSDSNNLGKSPLSIAHPLYPSAPMSVIPPAIIGLNELMADGHVSWYRAHSGALYYITDGTSGGAGVFVQDNR